VNYRLSSLAGIIASLILTGTAFAGKGLASYLGRPDSWFASSEAKQAASNILSFQSPLGGWPQSYPPDGQYHRHITFNDDAIAMG
jgi:hypothetical protein